MTGETPVVDVQTSTKRQVVLSNAVIEAIPDLQGYGNLLATVPGISGTGLDVSSNVRRTSSRHAAAALMKDDPD